jgi:hypothetical protein
LCWLALFALPELQALPEGFQTVQQWTATAGTWDRPIFVSLALIVLDTLHDLPLPWLLTSAQ